MGAISSEALAAKLAKGKPPSAILLLGTDAYLREASRERIIEASIDPGARDWAVSRFSAKENGLGLALARASTFPLLCRRQVVVVSELQAVEDMAEEERDAATESLGAYLKNPAPFTVLVLEADTLDQRMKFAKMLGQEALVVLAELPQDPRERARLAAMVARQMAREQHSAIDADAAEELVELCNANLAAMRSEIEKLATYAGPEQPIRRADVEAIVVSEKQYSVWELAEVLAAGQRSRAFTFLANVLQKGESAPGVVGAMAWMYRKLLEAQDLGPHISGQQGAGRLGMRLSTAELALRQARKIPRQQLTDGIRALYEADNQLKSGSGNDRAVMEFLVARLMRAPVGSEAKSRS